jgi:hypothetical protein
MHDNSLRNLQKFQPGQSGNPNGRPPTGRNRLTEAFVGDVVRAWEREGSKALDNMARRDGPRFVELCARLVPRDVQVSLQSHTSGLTDQDLVIFKAIKQGIPDASSRSPDEVLSYVLEAIQAHGAKVINSDKT